MSTDTVTSERLIYTDLAGNNNKYWHADVNGTTLHVNWGRVGTPVGQSKSYEYVSETIALKKLEQQTNGKLRKGYTRQHTVGGNRPQNVAVIAKVQIEHSNDPETTALIDFLVKRNIHKIEGTTSIKYDGDQLTTPLGPVTAEGLDEAQKLLLAMAKRGADLGTLANQYLRIIPRDIGRRKVDPADLFGAQRQLETEQATLDSLRVVVRDVESKTVAAAPNIFSTKLSVVDAKEVDFRIIKKIYESGLNRMHQSATMKLHRVWEAHIEHADKAFEERLGNIKQLWHGTKDANLLSILKNGYVIPKRGSSIAVTGRMYGDGVYFSDQSTKSLNYASGYWGGGRSQRCFMIFNDVAMGKEYYPTRGWSMGGGLPKGYDSTFAKAGSGVMNNEMIVYRTSQVRPVFLCEFR